MAKIRHLAICTDLENIEKLVEFYTDVFEMTVTRRSPFKPGKGGGVWLTDGYMQVALLLPVPSREKGVDHFGFTVEADERDTIFAKLKKYGIEPFQPPPDRPYVEDGLIDVDGNKVDISTSGLRASHGLAATGASD